MCCNAKNLIYALLVYWIEYLATNEERVVRFYHGVPFIEERTLILYVEVVCGRLVLSGIGLTPVRYETAARNNVYVRLYNSTYK